MKHLSLAINKFATNSYLSNQISRGLLCNLDGSLFYQYHSIFHSRNLYILNHKLKRIANERRNFNNALETRTCDCNQHSLTNNRLLSTSSSTALNKEADKRIYTNFLSEITFTTPYGKIAGHEWGNPLATKKIICIHGWLDNCASFQRMLPHFLAHNNNAQNYHVIAYDQSGVGLSCHRPIGYEYSHMSQVVELRRILRELQWTKYSIVGHSLGTQYGFINSCLYPDEVEGFVSIDLAFPVIRDDDFLKGIVRSIEEQLKFEQLKFKYPTQDPNAKAYSREEALERLMSKMAINRESAEVLMTRGATKREFGYMFNRDVRVRNRSIEFWPEEQRMLSYLKGYFRPNFTIVLGKDSVFYDLFIGEKFDSYRKIYEKNCKSFDVVALPGTHHLHMNNPESVANVVANFFDKLSLKEEK